MYRVSYYSTTGGRYSKLFAEFHDAMRFSFGITTDRLFQIIKESE